jgi:DNA-binding NarL/FixJ family response regulator
MAFFSQRRKFFQKEILARRRQLAALAAKRADSIHGRPIGEAMRKEPPRVEGGSPAWQRLGQGVSNSAPGGPAPVGQEGQAVLGMHADGLFYPLIARNVGLSKNTVKDIVRRSDGESLAPV